MPAAVTVTRRRRSDLDSTANSDLVDLAATAELLGVQVNGAQVHQKRVVRNRREGTVKDGDMLEPDPKLGRCPA